MTETVLPANKTKVRSREGLNLPGINLGISAFTKRDRECLEFALGQGVDAVSQSFIESAADVNAVRSAAEKLGHHPFIIAKIERADAVKHYDEILAASDGIMVARGASSFKPKPPWSVAIPAFITFSLISGIAG